MDPDTSSADRASTWRSTGRVRSTSSGLPSLRGRRGDTPPPPTVVPARRGDPLHQHHKRYIIVIVAAQFSTCSPSARDFATVPRDCRCPAILRL